MIFSKRGIIIECLCPKQKTNQIKIKADLGTDPVWCHICGCNLDLDTFPISGELSNQLFEWVTHYGQWLDFEREQLIEGGQELELVHNHLGEGLADKLQKELGDTYKVHYVKSTSAILYKDHL